MAQAGFTPIQLYFSTTASATPSAGNLANGELAINITDGRLFYKDNGGTVRVLAGTGGSGVVAGSNTQVQFNNNGVFGASANMTFNGTRLTVADLADSGLTSGRVVYSTTGGALTDAAGFTYNGTTLTVDTTSTNTNFRVENGSFNRVGALRLVNDGFVFDSFDQNNSASQRAFIWQSGGSEQMRLTSTGLGIGTSSPNYRADILASNFRGLRVQSSGDDAIITMGSQIASSQYWSIAATSNTSGQGSNRFIIETTDANAGGTVTPRLTLDASGNLGLGVAPSAWNSYRALQFAGGGSLVSFGNAAEIWSNAFYNGSSNVYIANGFATRYHANANGAHAWYTAPSGTAGSAISFTQAMTLDASGNLGVGTTSPAYRLDVSATGTTVSSAFRSDQSEMWMMLKDSGTTLGHVRLGSSSGAMLLYAGNNERARIDSSGNFMIGTTTAIEKFTVQGWASINGQGGISGNASTIVTNCNGGSWYGIMIQNQSTSISNAMTFCSSTQSVIGSIIVSATATSFNTSSDYRLKEQVRPMTGALAKVAALKPVTYKWKADGSDGEGFIAHELAEVCPHAVTGEKDAVNEDGSIKPQGIDTSFLVATLTAAIQEQQAIIEQLKADVAALKGA